MRRDEWQPATSRRLRVVLAGAAFILWVVLFGLLGLVFKP